MEVNALSLTGIAYHINSATHETIGDITKKFAESSNLNPSQVRIYHQTSLLSLETKITSIKSKVPLILEIIKINSQSKDPSPPPFLEKMNKLYNDSSDFKKDKIQNIFYTNYTREKIVTSLKATRKPPNFEEDVSHLMDMGFSRENCEKVLISCNFDMNLAAECLINPQFHQQLGVSMFTANGDSLNDLLGFLQGIIVNMAPRRPSPYDQILQHREQGNNDHGSGQLLDFLTNHQNEEEENIIEEYASTDSYDHDHQEEEDLLNHTSSSIPPPPPPTLNPISNDSIRGLSNQLSEEEKSNLRELLPPGVDFNEAVQIYLACDRDLNSTIACLT